MPKVSKTLDDIISIDPETGYITVHYDDMYFEDTKALSPAANAYRENGTYCPYHPEINKKQYLSFWREERRRCLEGYTAPNGIYITGYHYFYLNYCPIEIIKEEETPDGTEVSERKTDFPRFYDGDFLWFHLVEYARKNQKFIAVLKARRKGFSYKIGSMLMRNYYHRRSTKNYAIASLEKFLNEDGILNKTWDYMSFIDEHTGWGQPRQVKNQDLHKRASYLKKIKGKIVEKGLKNEIIGLTLKDDPDKVRGKAGELMVYEEAGKFPELLSAWGIATPTVRQGNKTLGVMIAFGTGGTEDANFAPMEELFFNPDAHHVLEFNNIWDDGAQGSSCGYFVPNALNLDGFMDEHGNSLMEEARAFEQEERKKKKKSNKTSDYEQWVAEHAETPAEAILETNVNQFPTAELNEQYNSVRANNRHKVLTHGKLVETEQGIQFKPDQNAKPILSYPHGKKDDLTGCISILESPRKMNGKIPPYMYYVCHDPYAHDSSTDGESLGAAYVIKRTNSFSPTYNECIVASYVGRPDTQDDYNRNLFMLAEYYNAKIGFENDRGDVIGYAKRFRKLGMLQEEFEMLYKKELKSSAVNRPYGMHMTTPRIDQGELYVRDWLTEVVRTDEDGEVLRLHTIFDLALLKELIKYNKKGNFDRVRALMVGMYQSKELHNTAVNPKSTRKNVDQWLDKHYRQELIHGQ